MDQVSTQSDVAAIAEQLVADLHAHPAEWENPTLERFLDALAARLRPSTNSPTNRVGGS